MKRRGILSQTVILQHDNTSLHVGNKTLEKVLDLISVLFWHIMQPMVVILYQRFGTTHWSHFQGLRTQRRKVVNSLVDIDVLFNVP